MARDATLLFYQDQSTVAKGEIVSRLYSPDGSSTSNTNPSVSLYPLNCIKIRRTV